MFVRAVFCALIVDTCSWNPGGSTINCLADNVSGLLQPTPHDTSERITKHMDEPDRSSTPPQEADDHPPPSRTSRPTSGPIETEVLDATRMLSDQELRELGGLCRRVLGQLPNTGSVRVRVVDDAEMAAAHARFCGLDTTTDVLTFDLAAGDTDPAEKVLDTDLIVCLDEARRQAALRTHDQLHELLLYIVHGVLHCLGHDDADRAAYERMHAREDALLKGAGVGALFGTDTETETRS